MNSPYLKYFIQQLRIAFLRSCLENFMSLKNCYETNLRHVRGAFSYIGTLTAALCRLLLKVYMAAMLELLVVEKPKCSYKRDV